MNTASGLLIIQDVPDNICKEKVKQFLLKTLKNCDSDKIDSLLDRPPVTLGGHISEKIGKKLAERLSSLGANTIFVAKKNPSTASPKDVKRKRTGHSALDATDRHDSSNKGITKLCEEESDSCKLRLEDEISDKSPHEPISGNTSKSEPDIFRDQPLYKQRPLRYRIADQIAEVNKELWIIFTMVAVAGLMNYLVTSQYMILGLYTFPTIMSAYFYGRRHAVMTAVLTIIIVGVMIQFNNIIFTGRSKMKLATGKWYHMMAWGSVLICTAYAMGTLYERHMEKVKELRKTYQGLIVILRHFISKDQYTENHCYRVSVYASKIAAYLGLDEETIEDIRSAALLHDIGKLKVSRELLYKAARLSEAEYKQIQKHVSKSAEILEPLKGPLGRIIPIILVFVIGSINYIWTKHLD